MSTLAVNDSNQIHLDNQYLGQVRQNTYTGRWFVQPAGYVIALEGSFETPEQALHGLVAYHRGMLRNQAEQKRLEMVDLQLEITRLDAAAQDLGTLASELDRCWEHGA